MLKYASKHLGLGTLSLLPGSAPPLTGTPACTVPCTRPLQGNVYTGLRVWGRDSHGHSADTDAHTCACLHAHAQPRGQAFITLTSRSLRTQFFFFSLTQFAFFIKIFLNDSFACVCVCFQNFSSPLILICDSSETS